MGFRIGFFDLWRPGYGAATVNVYLAGTTTPADIFTDEDLATAAPNPQTLDEKTINSISYGKWQQPLYTEPTIELVVSTGDRTGIVRPPLFSLDGADGGDVEVTSSGGSSGRPLDERFSDVIHVDDFGTLGAVAATNNTIIEAAIGVASGRVGSAVWFPSGTFPFTDLNLPAGVVLRGNGRGATILECQTADDCITIGGDGAGLSRITIDGVNLVADSRGVFAKAKNEIVIDDVEIKRFDFGIYCKGGRRNNWRELYIDNCNYGAKLHGDEDAGGGADGDEFRNNAWRGGRVSNCLEIGVDLSFEDLKCWHNRIIGVGFDDNAATALQVNGARHTDLPGCWFSGNTVNMDVNDDDDTDNEDINTVVGLHIDGASFDTGEIIFAGLCQDIEFSRCEFTGTAVTLNQPTNNVLARDCIEDADVIISETGLRWTRYRSIDHSASSGVTTDDTAYVAWSYELDPGQVVIMTARVIGNARNSEKSAEYYRTQSARRPGSELDYDTQTVDFTLGEIITGGTSEATARIVADTDAGGSGTLTLRDIDGEFINNEPLTGDLGGEALSAGELSTQDAELVGSLVTHFAREDDAGWQMLFAVLGGEVQVTVEGDADDEVEWLVHADVIAT